MGKARQDVTAREEEVGRAQLGAKERARAGPVLVEASGLAWEAEHQVGCQSGVLPEAVVAIGFLLECGQSPAAQPEGSLEAGRLGNGLTRVSEVEEVRIRPEEGLDTTRRR